jgi:hypothetical protein
MVSYDDAVYVVLNKLESENRPTSAYCHGMFGTGVDGPCFTGSTEILLGANAVF